MQSYSIEYYSAFHLFCWILPPEEFYFTGCYTPMAFYFAESYSPFHLFCWILIFETTLGLRINAHVVAPSCDLFLTCGEIQQLKKT
jgi:hypothetical protein